jgi:hypothetical protein
MKMFMFKFWEKISKIISKTKLKAFIYSLFLYYFIVSFFCDENLSYSCSNENLSKNQVILKMLFCKFLKWKKKFIDYENVQNLSKLRTII